MAGELYHVYHRGVEGRIIFPSQDYYLRFISALRFFNTTRPVTLREYFAQLKTGVQPLQEEEPLVQIGAFNLRPTHYHLLTRSLADGSLSLFMQKLNSGFTAFFNLKNSRSGPLLRGRYKLKHINDDRYAKHVQAYIALNALDKDMPDWRMGIRDVKKAKKIIHECRWSSFSSYFGNNKFSGIIDPNFIKDFFDDARDFERYTLSWTRVKLGEALSVLADTGVEPL